MNELAPLARLGDPDALDTLLRMGYRLVSSIVTRKGWFLPPGWGDWQDLLQEGMIGLMEALQNWQPGRALSFVGFAVICIDRQLDQAVRTARRKKHEVLNQCRRLDEPMPHRHRSHDAHVTLLELLPLPATDEAGRNPLETVLTAAGMDEARQVIGELRAAVHSDLERHVFDNCVIRLRSYKAVAEELRLPWKSVDNASQRVMRQIRARALELSCDERYSPEMQAVLWQCSVPGRRRGGRPAVTDWIGDLAKGA